jgi:hypothetical protein
MKKSFLLVAGLALLLGLAVAGVSAQKPGTAAAVPLRITIESYDSSGTPCAVCGDGRSSQGYNVNEYVDGIDGVSAGFSRYGHLGFYFGQGTSRLRWINIDYSNPYLLPDPPPSPGPLSGPRYSGDFITFKVSDPYVNLQDMRAGNDKAQCVATGWTAADPNNTNVKWNNNFHRAGSVFHDDRTSYAVVTCTEEDFNGRCTKWEIEPKKTYLDNNSGQTVTIACNNTTGQVESVAGVLTIETVKNQKQTYTNYGLWKLPFKLTVRRK